MLFCASLIEGMYIKNHNWNVGTIDIVGNSGFPLTDGGGQPSWIPVAVYSMKMLSG